MKKILSLTLCVALSIGLAACQSPVPVTTDPPVETPAPAQETVTPTEAAVPEEPADDRGIDGLDAFVMRSLFEGEPFNVPYGDDTPAPDEAADVFAATAASSSVSDGITYDYSLVLDSDGEIISGSVGVSSADVSADTLRSAASLYFWTALICPHDGLTTDDIPADDLVEDALANASTDGYKFTVGNAVYTAYSAGGASYWIDIAKAE